MNKELLDIKKKLKKKNFQIKLSKRKFSIQLIITWVYINKTNVNCREIKFKN